MNVNLTVNEIILIIALVEKGDLNLNEIPCILTKDSLLEKQYAVKSQLVDDVISITSLGKTVYNTILKP